LLTVLLQYRLQRRLESLETQKLELQLQVDRGRKLTGRLQQEMDRLRAQVPA
jgi:hypothetical protein